MYSPKFLSNGLQFEKVWLPFGFPAYYCSHTVMENLHVAKSRHWSCAKPFAFTSSVVYRHQYIPMNAKPFCAQTPQRHQNFRRGDKNPYRKTLHTKEEQNRHVEYVRKYMQPFCAYRQTCIRRAVFRRGCLHADIRVCSKNNNSAWQFLAEASKEA